MTCAVCAYIFKLLSLNCHLRFVNGVYEFGYGEGHRGSIVEVAGKVWLLPPTVVIKNRDPDYTRVSRA